MNVELVVLSSPRARIVFRALQERDLIEHALRICDEANVDAGDVFGGDQRRAQSNARQAIWAFLDAGGMKLSAIGSLFGKHHTTVLSGIRAHAYRTAKGAAA